MQANHIRLVLCVSLLAVTFSAAAQEANSLEALEEYITSSMAEHHVAGLSVVVVQGDTVRWSKAYGYADVDRKKPFSTRSILNIGSVSKTFTAAAIMQLWERELIGLDEDINVYLPISVRNPAYPETAITVRHLLTHTSSIRDNEAYGQSYLCGDPEISLQDWISAYFLPGGAYYDATQNFAAHPPGAEGAYSNLGFGVLGLIVEEVSGMPFPAYCRQHLFEPLDMDNTGWYLNEVDTSTHALPTIFIEEEIKAMVETGIPKLVPEFRAADPATDYYLGTCLYSFPNYPDGALRTSVDQLAHYLMALMRGGEYAGRQILQPETISAMWSLQYDHDAQGLCWWIWTFEEAPPMWGHGGDDPGVIAGIFIEPKTRLGIAFLANSNNVNRSRLVEKIYAAVAGE